MNVKVKVDNQVFILDEDFNWRCAHENVEIDSTEHISSNPDSNYYWTEEFYVCADCEEELEGDPAQDRAEYLADMELMEARCK